MVFYLRVFINSTMKTTLLVCLFFSAFILRAQENYSEIQIGSKYTIEEIHLAIQKANWCGYYHETSNFQLTFDDGAIVYLKSKNQLLPLESSLSENCFQSKFSESNDVFIIAENGNLFVPKSTQFFKPKN